LAGGVNNDHYVQRPRPLHEQHDLAQLFRRVLSFRDDFTASQQLLEFGQDEVNRA
jgi:hypothetical protein